MAIKIPGQRMSAAVLVLFLCAFGEVLSADPVFYSIGPDNSSQPRNFNSIPSNGSGPTLLFLLGDGSVGFNGGLTYRPTDSSFYVMGNDGAGTSTLQSFTLIGGSASLTSHGSPGTGFLSGLTFDSVDGNLYAIEDDSMVTGHSYLDRINPGTAAASRVLDLGLGFEGGGLFTGGLTFDPNNSNLYAFGADSFGVSRSFYEINLGSSTVSHEFDLGPDESLGFNGGLLYDPGTNQFYAIANDISGNSQLDSFTLGGGGAFAEVGAMGGAQGFNNVGLTEIPPTSAVPEPSGLIPSLLLMAGVIMAHVGRRHHKP